MCSVSSMVIIFVVFTDGTTIQARRFVFCSRKDSTQGNILYTLFRILRHFDNYGEDINNNSNFSMIIILFIMTIMMMSIIKTL